jgi:hypothetical protein
MSPDTIAVGVFSLLGVLVGLFGERLVRRIGNVRCKKDSWKLQAGNGIAEERYLQVTFVNRKEVPVTVMEMQVLFYKGGVPLEEWVRPGLAFVDARGQRSPAGPVTLLPNIAFPLTISVTAGVTAGRDDIREELAKADRAEFVARIVRRLITMSQSVA